MLADGDCEASHILVWIVRLVLLASAFISISMALFAGGASEKMCIDDIMRMSPRLYGTV